MSGTTWIIIGCICAALTAFSIPYGFYLKSKEKLSPPPPKSSNSINDANIQNSGDVVVGNKITYNQFQETNKKNEPKPASLSEKQLSSKHIELLQTLGGPGTGNGQFQFGGGTDTNAGIYVTEQFLYVTDWSNNRLQIFKQNNDNVWSFHDSLTEQNGFYSDIFVDLDGNIYLQKQGEILVYNSTKESVSTLKVNISNFRRFTLDKDGNIFLQSGSDNNIIEKYSNNGELIVTFGGFGNSDGKFNNSGWTGDIATDSSGNVYMQDVGEGKIQKFDNNGTFLNKWDVSIAAYSYMAIDEADNIYVTERGLSELNKYNTDGKLLKKYNLPPSVVMGGGSYIFVRNKHLFISHRSDHNIKIFSL